MLLAVRPQGQADDAAGGEGIAQCLAEGTAADLLCGFGIVRQKEGDVEDRHQRVEAAEECGRCDGRLKRAELDAFGHLALLAELSLRENLELDGAVGALSHEGRDLLKQHVTRLLRGFQMADLGDEVRRPCRRCGRKTDDGRQCDCLEPADYPVHSSTSYRWGQERMDGNGGADWLSIAILKNETNLRCVQ